jgi:YD repeat-containing protein
MFRGSPLRCNGRKHFLNSFILVVASFAGIGPAHAGETTTYSYDALGRLANAAHSGTVNSGLNQAYTYDAADNRSNVTVTGSPYSSTTRVVVLPLLGGFVLPFSG